MSEHRSHQQIRTETNTTTEDEKWKHNAKFYRGRSYLGAMELSARASEGWSFGVQGEEKGWAGGKSRLGFAWMRERGDREVLRVKMGVQWRNDRTVVRSEGIRSPLIGHQTDQGTSWPVCRPIRRWSVAFSEADRSPDRSGNFLIGP